MWFRVRLCHVIGSESSSEWQIIVLTGKQDHAVCPLFPQGKSDAWI